VEKSINGILENALCVEFMRFPFLLVRKAVGQMRCVMGVKHIRIIYDEANRRRWRKGNEVSKL
jgi:hypothetical protein